MTLSLMVIGDLFALSGNGSLQETMILMQADTFAPAGDPA